MRTSEKGYKLSKVLSDYVRKLDGGSRSIHTGRAITSAVPGVQDNDDPFFAPLDVSQ